MPFHKRLNLSKIPEHLIRIQNPIKISQIPIFLLIFFRNFQIKTHILFEELFHAQILFVCEENPFVDVIVVVLVWEIYYHPKELDLAC